MRHLKSLICDGSIQKDAVILKSKIFFALFLYFLMALLKH